MERSIDITGENKYFTLMQFRSLSFEDTVNFGEKIGRSLKGGEVLILSGVLGSGKTAFTKGVARALRVEDPVTSPSFSILNLYGGTVRLFHFDFYRIDSLSEMEDLLEDYIYRTDGVTVIEWGEDVCTTLDEYYFVRFEIKGGSRTITVERRGG
jgi:tRNA threonylcarbamoyladenosine biosynthesis protein TsaE